jgi:ribosome-associated protein
MADTTRPRRSPPRLRARAPARRLPRQLLAAVAAARSKKASDVTVLDLRKAGAFTDYFVICTGGNARQVQAVADAVEQALKASHVRPSHVEGYERAEWVLLDYFDFIVHVFSPAARHFYALDRLWGAAARVELPAEDAFTRARA